MGRRVTRPLLHMIGNAHIDPVWLWQWPEGYQEVLSTFRSALARLQEYPEFEFTHDSVCYLAWVEETDPDMFESIRRRVAEGRWHVIGGWWVEPDCNIPAGESYVRQALYGQGTCARSSASSPRRAPTSTPSGTTPRSRSSSPRAASTPTSSFARRRTS